MMKTLPKLICAAICLTMALAGVAPADTVTLYPNGAGDSTQLTPNGDPTPDPVPANWECVIANDSDTLFVESGGNSVWRTDLYQLDDVSLTGTINSVTVYVSARSGNRPRP